VVVKYARTSTSRFYAIVSQIQKTHAWILDDTHSWWLAIVGKLEDVNHIRTLFLLHVLP
jgi:hypothetical protein